MKPDGFNKTLEMAILHGSHFYRKLAEAALAADPINKAKIFRAFPEITKSFGPKSILWESSYGKPSHLKLIK